MNLFARGMGGFFSDVANNKWGMPGRLGVQSVLLALEAIFVIIFSQTKTLAAAIIVMVIFSFFVQAAEGSSFGIVPYVDEPHTGSVTGIVGAGGNVGAVCFSLVFKYMSNDKNSLMIMGGTVLISAVLSLFIRIEGYNSLFFCPFSSPEVAVPDEEAAARQNRDARLEDASSGSDG
jgi:MFS transporter, NNP family, nitrate/nitrite transporter